MEYHEQATQVVPGNKNSASVRQERPELRKIGDIHRPAKYKHGQKVVWREQTWTISETLLPYEHEPHLKAEYRDYGYRLTRPKANASPIIAESELKSVEEISALRKKVEQPVAAK